MTDQPEVGFAHRQNADGTIDSICYRCFRTVATTHDEASLYPSEVTHICAEDGPQPVLRTSGSQIHGPKLVHRKETP
jgi:hypothetical protein